MVMSDLIKRIEAADGPDRDLDAAIWEYLGLAPKYDNSKNNYGCWHYRGEGRYHFADDSSWGRNKYAPEYTSSIDAAMTLVPEGAHVTITMDGDFWLVAINGFVSRSKYPALALCAAAMKSVMAKNEG